MAEILESDPGLQANYRALIQQAREALGIKHLGLITPIRSLPVAVGKDTGIGSLPAAEPFFEFVTQLGFDVVQVDPEGKTKLADPSPYAGTVFSINPILIDLSQLTEDAWGNILSQETLARVRENNPNKDGAEVAYAYVFNAQNEALAEAYRNFQQKRSVLQEIDKRFDAFVKANQLWLDPDALYEALSLEYGNDYWPAWKSNGKGGSAKLDKNLFNEADAKTQQRKEELKTKYADVIGAYQFAQFIASEQKCAFKNFSKKHNFSVMADRQVGLSDRDVWAYQHLFLRDWALGAPPDYFSAYGQAWGFPVFDPEQLFSPADDSSDVMLGEGGLLLQRLYEKIFSENPGGVRIDHIIGLIDPWVYPAVAQSTRDGGRLFSSPEHPILGQYAYIKKSDLNTEQEPDHSERVKPDALSEGVIQKYAAILDKIVIPAAEKFGVAQSSIICEDLGTLTNPVQAVMKQRGYSGIRVTQFVDPNDPKHMYRGKNIEPRHWVTPGTHDNEPLLLWAQQLLEKGGGVLWQHAENLAEDLKPNPDERDGYKHDLAHNALALTRAKFAELFASPATQVQVFFTDLFGMETAYNRPSTSSDENWVLRIPQDYKTAYFNAVKTGKALNLPEAMATALRARGGDAELIAELEQCAEGLRQINL